MCLDAGVSSEPVPPHEPQPPRRALPRGYDRRDNVDPAPVWVRLSALYPPAEETPGNADAGADDQVGGGSFVGRHGLAPVPVHRQGRLDLTREVIGRLHHWERDLAGRWFGLVDYAVPLVDDFRPLKRVECGLVPAAALRPRDPHDAPDPRR